MGRLFMFVGLLVLLPGCCLCHDSAERKRESQKKQAQAEAEKKKKQAEKEEAERTIKERCGHSWGGTEWKSRCRDMVKERLGSPSYADFSMLLDVAEGQMEDKCIEFYGSTVTVKNAFGTKVKYRFRCSHLPKNDDEVNLVFVELDGPKL